VRGVGAVVGALLCAGSGAGVVAFWTCAIAGIASAAAQPRRRKRLDAGFIRHVDFDRLRRDFASLAGQEQERSCKDGNDEDEEY
jgi:hypothetical protein